LREAGWGGGAVWRGLGKPAFWQGRLWAGPIRRVARKIFRAGSFFSKKQFAFFMFL
jgi:hypothetical protein